MESKIGSPLCKGVPPQYGQRGEVFVVVVVVVAAVAVRAHRPFRSSRVRRPFRSLTHSLSVLVLLFGVRPTRADREVKELTNSEEAGPLPATFARTADWSVLLCKSAKVNNSAGEGRWKNEQVRFRQEVSPSSAAEIRGLRRRGLHV